VGLEQEERVLDMEKNTGQFDPRATLADTVAMCAQWLGLSAVADRAERYRQRASELGKAPPLEHLRPSLSHRRSHLATAGSSNGGSSSSEVVSPFALSAAVGNGTITEEL
jgi:hypothetical protein